MMGDDGDSMTLSCLSGMTSEVTFGLMELKILERSDHVKIW